MNGRGNGRERGATLVATVLVVATLLAALLALTGQQAVQARRTLAEGGARLQAGYAAEAGLSRAQARLTLAGLLLSPAAYDIPADADPAAVLADVLSLCGLSTLPAGSAPQVLCRSADSSGGLLAGVDPGTLSGEGSPRLNLLVRYLRPGAAARLGFSGPGDVRAFWAGLLRGRAAGSQGASGQLGGASYSSAHGLTLLSVERLAPDRYRLTFGRPEVQAGAQGAGAGGARRFLAVPADTASATFTLGREPYSRYLLFVGQPFTSPAARERGERVTLGADLPGPVHTNGHFRFGGSPRFSGVVSSAGCGADQAPGCADPQPGAFLGDRFVPLAQLGPSEDAPRPADCPDCARPRFLGGVRWQSPFVPLPGDDAAQRQAALSGGLALPALDALTLAAGRVSPAGGPLQDAQLIGYTPRGGAAVQLAVLESGAVYRQQGGGWARAAQVDGEWRADGLPPGAVPGALAFGGVIDVSGDIAALSGPARTRPAEALSAAPALAPFARLTVAASGDIHIRSDLRLAEPPCPADVRAGADPQAAGCVAGARAVLGLYSAGGDVALDSPAKYPGAGVPAGVSLHAFLMAARGRVLVDGYELGAADTSLGDVQLIGGLTQAYYGPFGLNDGRGFGRALRADARAAGGLTPPAFPVIPGWTLGTPDFSLRGMQELQEAP